MSDKATPTQVVNAIKANVTSRGKFKSNPFKKTILNKLKLEDVERISSAFESLADEIKEDSKNEFKNSILKQFDELPEGDKEDLLRKLKDGL